MNEHRHDVRNSWASWRPVRLLVLFPFSFYIVPLFHPPPSGDPFLIFGFICQLLLSLSLSFPQYPLTLAVPSSQTPHFSPLARLPSSSCSATIGFNASTKSVSHLASFCTEVLEVIRCDGRWWVYVSVAFWHCRSMRTGRVAILPEVVALLSEIRIAVDS